MTPYIAEKCASKHAFTLVELSIVLVILGLLAGGVLSGQALIRAAEVRSVTADIARYRSVIYSFRDKYFAFPGDMANATLFWGEQNNDPAACAALDYTTPSTDKRTCNGNGNGAVDINTAAERYESFRFWQHLANAGLIEGSYSGVGGPLGNLHGVAGVNTPKSKMSNTVYGLGYADLPVGSATDFPEPSSSMLWIGAQNTANNLPGQPSMKPEEAWNIDTKLDDGRPGFGIVHSWRAGSSVPNCTTTNAMLTADADAAAAVYKLDRSDIVCAIKVRVD